MKKGISKVLKRFLGSRSIECGEGWYDLLIELDEKLNKIYPDYELEQVKEKFGTLRYYCSLFNCKDQTIDKTHLFYKIIYEYEKKSGTICEVCGETGRETCIRSWSRTFCNKHLIERLKYLNLPCDNLEQYFLEPYNNK